MAGPPASGDGVDVPQRVRLDRLMPMQCATVVQVDAEEQAHNQLMAMGVCVGRRVELIKAGDPLILRVLGSRIGLSSRLAAGVWVTTCGSDGCETAAAPGGPESSCGGES